MDALLNYFASNNPYYLWKDWVICYLSQLQSLGTGERNIMNQGIKSLNLSQRSSASNLYRGQILVVNVLHYSFTRAE